MLAGFPFGAEDDILTFMNDLLVGILSAVLSTNQPAAVSNLVQQKTGLTVSLPDKNDPVEIEFQKLLAEDDAAQEETDRWITEEQKFKEQGVGLSSVTLRERLKDRLAIVKKAYQDFLQRHPDHARAHLAYGSFLNDMGEEELAHHYYEKGRDLDPSNPAAWNNLANWHGHNGGITNAFEFYARAIQLNPGEPIYYENLATTVYMFRRDATNYFKITEQQVFAMAMLMYRKAMDLDPENFILASDYAQSYYGFSAPKSGDAAADDKAHQKYTDEALAAWQNAYRLARDDIEREGVRVHFARFQINAGRLAEARKNLDSVTNAMFDSTKKALTKKLESREKEKSPTAANK